MLLHRSSEELESDCHSPARNLLFCLDHHSGVHDRLLEIRCSVVEIKTDVVSDSVSVVAGSLYRVEFHCENVIPRVTIVLFVENSQVLSGSSIGTIRGWR